MRLTFTTRPKTPAAVVQDFENSGGFHLCLIEFWSRVNDGLRIDLSGRCALRTEAAVMFHQAEKNRVSQAITQFHLCWTQAQKSPGSNRSRDAVG